MRSRWAALAAAWLTCAACTSTLRPAYESGNASYGEVSEVSVSGVSFGGGAAGGAALAALAVGALRARGVSARAAPPPAACRPPGAPDDRACLDATLAALARGVLHAALVPAARAPAAAALRDAGLEELGEAAPAAHRACLATGAARSLLDFADASLAALYHVPAARLHSVVAPEKSCRNASVDPECGGEGEEGRATLVAADEAETRVLRRVVRRHGLRARVVLAAPGVDVLAALAPRAAVLCGRALDPAAATVLGPPPCSDSDCPFEARRLLKVVNARVLAHAASAHRALAALALDEAALRTLERDARVVGPEAAARAALARLHGGGAPPEVRVAVMVPASARREAVDARALRAAAELAETDAELTSAALDFKVQLLDDACSGARAFKHLTDALGSEFGALSAVVGPACGAPWEDVARQAAALALPVLAYTRQAVGESGGTALLAAGDARRVADAWAAILARMRWRRVAVLSEAGTRAAADAARLGAHVLAHTELPGDADFDFRLLEQWAERAASVRARVLYVCVEDARAARAALCAGWRAGLRPAAGTVWLLPALPPHALRAAPGDAHNCSADQLAEAAEGHLSVAAAWAERWRRAPDERWAARWAARCRRGRPGAGGCGAPPAAAALLYDVLRLWAGALARLVARAPSAADDLHRADLVRSLVADAASTPYSGLTGAFQWEAAGGGGGAMGRARLTSLVVRQWSNGSHAVAGSWDVAGLQLRAHELRWLTADGRAPDDGAPHCALQALADALHSDCGAAFAAAGALALAALAGPAAALAWRYRRRAEREYRARLAELGLRALAPVARDAARWEVARERVVINRKLGTGAFGTVYGGHALLGEGRRWTAVAVKTLKAGASTEEKLDFLSEAEAMKRFEHENVVRLLGVVTKTEPVCTVMEFMLYGDLKSYLLARRQLAGAGGAAGAEVAPARLTGMALDVARGLSYLARLRYVHRDVAARNCLVSAHRSVKLADFGMTRLVFEHDYYRFSRKGLLPVRWMAPESLALGVFSPASDVWAFGVLLYEIVTFGSLPFQGLSNAEVLARVKAGRTLDLPPGLKPQMEALVRSCWRQEARARPSAAVLAAQLADAPRLLTPVLDVPLDALPLALEPAASRDSAQARWVSWAAPLSAATDSTYLSADARDSDAFQPAPALETDVFQPAPALETDVFQPAPALETDVFQPAPALETDAFLPAPRDIS